MWHWTSDRFCQNPCCLWNLYTSLQVWQAEHFELLIGTLLFETQFENICVRIYWNEVCVLSHTSPWQCNWREGWYDNLRVRKLQMCFHLGIFMCALAFSSITDWPPRGLRCTMLHSLSPCLLLPGLPGSAFFWMLQHYTYCVCLSVPSNLMDRPKHLFVTCHVFHPVFSILLSPLLI